MHPLEGFGDVCHKNGALLLVDTVASIAGAPFHADRLGVLFSIFSYIDSNFRSIAFILQRKKH